MADPFDASNINASCIEVNPDPKIILLSVSSRMAHTDQTQNRGKLSAYDRYLRGMDTSRARRWR